jgi:hypothetical protein
MISASWRRVGWSSVCAAGVLLLALAIGGVSVASDSALSPPVTVKSADGQLTVAVPRGALAKPTKIRVRVLKRAQYPAELRKVKLPRGTTVYALEPDGLRFRKAITISKRTSLKAAGFNLAKGVPIPVLASRDSKGRWERLDRTSITIHGDSLVANAKTRHFSELVEHLQGGLTATFTPPRITRSVDESFVATLRITRSGELRGSKFFSARSFAEGSVRGPRSPWNVSVRTTATGFESTATFVCKNAGPGKYSLNVSVKDTTPGSLFVQGVFFGSSGGDLYGTEISGSATCTAAKPPPPPTPLCTGTESLVGSNEVAGTFTCSEPIGGFDYTPGNKGDINSWKPSSCTCDGKSIYYRKTIPANTPFSYGVRTNQTMILPGRINVFDSSGALLSSFTPTPTGS